MPAAPQKIAFTIPLFFALATVGISKTHEEVVSAPANKVFSAAVKMAAKHFSITFKDDASRILTFQTRMVFTGVTQVPQIMSITVEEVTKDTARIRVKISPSVAGRVSRKAVKDIMTYVEPDPPPQKPTSLLHEPKPEVRQDILCKVAELKTPLFSTKPLRPRLTSGDICSNLRPHPTPHTPRRPYGLDT